MPILDVLVTYWLNFAQLGYTNGRSVPEWHALSEKNPAVMYFNETEQMGTVLSAASLKVLDAHFKWSRTMEGEVWSE